MRQHDILANPQVDKKDGLPQANDHGAVHALIHAEDFRQSLCALDALRSGRSQEAQL